MFVGVSARGDGEEEEDAAEVPRHGVVDEAAAVAVSAEAESPSLRTPPMVGCWWRRRDGYHQGFTRGTQARHQTLPLPRPHQTGPLIMSHIVTTYEN